MESKVSAAACTDKGEGSEWELSCQMALYLGGKYNFSISDGF